MKLHKETAAALKDQVLSYSRRLDKSIKDVQEAQAGSSVEAYRKLAGRIMGLLYTNLLMPIYSEFPDLEPSELKATSGNVPDGALPPELVAQLSSLMVDAREALLSLREKVGATGKLDFDEILDSIDATLVFLRRMASTP